LPRGGLEGALIRGEIEVHKREPVIDEAKTL
jgi:hypothetical protein